MTCLELQEILPEIVDGGRSPEQEAHLKSCSECADLVSDLNLISGQAKLLQEYAEPSPRVWNSIEIALREEGLIHQPQRDRSIVSAFSQRWGRGWLLPVAAAALLVFSLVLYKGISRQSGPADQTATAHGTPGTATASDKRNSETDDTDVLAAVASNSPAMHEAFVADLQNVNAYISDAQRSVDNDPNDEEARQSLMDAYDQKAAVYEMAMDRSY